MVRAFTWNTTGISGGTCALQQSKAFSTIIRIPKQMSNNSAQRKHETTAGNHPKELVKLIQQMSHRHHTLDVFSDFVELSALSISNAIDKTQFEARERRYPEIIAKYTPEEVQAFPKMLAELVMSFEDETATGSVSDVLGAIYMMLDLGNDRSGQFFTPAEISKLMARLLVGGGSDVRERGFLRLNEPACGAGGMVIAYADALQSAGLNYQDSMHAICVDVDVRCVHMTYLRSCISRRSSCMAMRFRWSNGRTGTRPRMSWADGAAALRVSAARRRWKVSPVRRTKAPAPSSCRSRLKQRPRQARSQSTLASLSNWRFSSHRRETLSGLLLSGLRLFKREAPTHRSRWSQSLLHDKAKPTRNKECARET